MWTALLLAAVGSACTVEYESRVVGSHPTEALVVVRVEADGLAAPQIDLVLYDADAGTERKRFPILTVDQGGDATIRSRAWTAAEAELTRLGIQFDAEAEPLPIELERGLPHPISVEACTLRFANARIGEGDEASKSLVATTLCGEGAAPTNRTLASWPWGSSGNSYHYVRSVWPLPDHRLAVIEANGCAEPGVHFFRLDPAR